MICFITPFVIPFQSEAVTDEMKIFYGWVMIGAIFLVMVVNLYFVLKFGIRNIGLIVTKWKNHILGKKMETKDDLPS